MPTCRERLPMATGLKSSKLNASATSSASSCVRRSVRLTVLPAVPRLRPLRLPLGAAAPPSCAAG